MPTGPNGCPAVFPSRGYGTGVRAATCGRGGRLREYSGCLRGVCSCKMQRGKNLTARKPPAMLSRKSSTCPFENRLPLPDGVSSFRITAFAGSVIGNFSGLPDTSLFAFQDLRRLIERVQRDALTLLPVLKLEQLSVASIARDRNIKFMLFCSGHATRKMFARCRPRARAFLRCVGRRWTNR